MNCFYAAFPICHPNNTANNPLNLTFLLVKININKCNRDNSAIVEANERYLPLLYGLPHIENHPGEPLKIMASSDCDRISSVWESSR